MKRVLQNLEWEIKDQDQAVEEYFLTESYSVVICF